MGMSINGFTNSSIERTLTPTATSKPSTIINIKTVTTTDITDRMATMATTVTMDIQGTIKGTQTTIRDMAIARMDIAIITIGVIAGINCRASVWN